MGAREQAAGGIVIGTQGWSYDAWDGWIYPRQRGGKPTAGTRLSHYSQLLPMVEVDSTYYAPQPSSRLRQWADATPEGFLFSAKVPKSITQEARLAGPEALAQLEHFIAAMRTLGPKLGPLVLQMSPGFRFPRDARALRTALEALPSLGGEGLQFCMEFRHPSWLTTEEIPALLREHGVVWVWNDWEPTESYLAPMARAIDTLTRSYRETSDSWAYVRLVGDHDLAINYRQPVIDRGRDLARWAELALKWRESRPGRLVYILLNNHYAGSSLRSAAELQRLLGLPQMQLPDHDDPHPSPSEQRQPALPGMLG